MLPIAVVGYFLLPFGVRLLFPKYVAGTHAAQIILFAAVAYGATMGANALNSLKAWSHLIGYQLGYSGLLIAGPFIGARLCSSPLNGVAYGMLSGHMAGAILSTIVTYAAQRTKAPVAELGRHVAAVITEPEMDSAAVAD